MGAVEVEVFLTYLAVERHVSASTQNQAKSALLFLKSMGVCLTAAPDNPNKVARFTLQMLKYGYH